MLDQIDEKEEATNRNLFGLGKYIGLQTLTKDYFETF